MIDLTDIQLDFLPDKLDGVYLVGGTLRDLLAGHHPSDIDLVVAGDIAHTAARIARKTGGRIIDLGKKKFTVLRVASQQAIVDITPLAHPSIEADLLQRDFTINAMAFDVNAQRLVDCVGGLADMHQKRIRMVTPTAFATDPARLVRAYRMAAVLHFTISAETREAIGRYRHLVGSVAGERIRAELIKIFSIADSAPIIMHMAASRLLTAIFPELTPAIGCMQNRHHRFDVFDHSLRVYEKVENLLAGCGGQIQAPAPDRLMDRIAGLAPIVEQVDLLGHAAMLKYAALLHDVGKPATRTVDTNGRVRFLGHAAKSADITMGISRRLRLSTRQRNVSDAVIRNHIRPLFLFIASEKGTLGGHGMVRFFRRCNGLTLPTIIHTMADIMAKDDILKDKNLRFISFCDRLLDAYVDYQIRKVTVPPLISGHDLIAIFGLSPSPRFRHLLNQVDEQRLSGTLTTRDQALKWVEADLMKTDADASA